MNAWTTLLSVAALTVCGCTVALKTDKSQCSSNGDCAALGAGFENTICGPQNTCVTYGCDTASECVEKNSQAPSLCRHSDRTCIKLEMSVDQGDGANCKVHAEANEIGNEDTIWIGVMQALSGPGSNLTIPSLNAYEIARKEFSVTAGGLPPISANQPRRKVAYVQCDDSDDAQAKVGVVHLINDVGVPAIVGMKNSGEYITFATNYTNPAGVLLTSGLAASPIITDIPSMPHLTWRTVSGSNVPQALGASVKALLEPRLRMATPPVVAAGEPLRVALVFAGNTFGRSQQALIEASLSFNGKTPAENGANYFPIDYGDPTAADAAAHYADVVQKIIAAKPHVILHAGNNEFWSGIVGGIESGWTASYRPYYVVTIGSVGVATYPVIGTDEAFRKRVLVSVSNYDPATLGKFINLYNSNYPNIPITEAGTGIAPAQGYDNFYSLIYAIAATTVAHPTGAQISETYGTKLNAGVQVNSGVDGIFKAFTEFSNGSPIDFGGVLGLYHLDPKTGDPSTPAAFHCITKDASGKAASTTPSGFLFDPTTKIVSGMSIADCL